ncbi:hypothetical protein GcM1_213031 [Golovinomyces cichoracearum]|uniref:Basic proline-rich protein n=1 Tax=Golovinomyces cichoracearum TaxID=62708 RepID=A0A420IUK7_9PEZI|nr:hypothetical protein GcM1_213031 [Golovinomyces cichoracearum]
MDPVHEAETIEGFRSPALTLRLKNSSFHLHHNYHSASEISLARQTTNSSLSKSGSPSSDTQTALDSPSSASSPLQGSLHLRPSNNVSQPPSMVRAQSMPVYNSVNLMVNSPTRRSAGLRGTVPRMRSPRKPIDEVFVGFPNLPNSSLPRNLDLVSGNESPTSDTLVGSNSPTNTNNATYFRSRRPESPRLSLQKLPTSSSNLSPSASFTYQPSMYSSRINDQNYNSNYCHSGSVSYPGSLSHSIPSTPTSTRSRSSSISSLETIPDSPDAEEAALIADQISDPEIDAGILDSFEVPKRRILRDINSGRARVLGTGFIREKRKRWSVCGGERRGDLNLDTIWED